MDNYYNYFKKIQNGCPRYLKLQYMRRWFRERSRMCDKAWRCWFMLLQNGLKECSTVTITSWSCNAGDNCVGEWTTLWKYPRRYLYELTNDCQVWDKPFRQKWQNGNQQEKDVPFWKRWFKYVLRRILQRCITFKVWVCLNFSRVYFLFLKETELTKNHIFKKIYL